MLQNEVNKDLIHRERRIPLFKNEPHSLAEMFYYANKEHPRSNALNFKKDGKWHSISSAEVIERSENIALGLNSLGIEAGERVAILASNSPSWTLADAGCQFAGIIDVPIYTTLTADSVKYIINDSQAKAIFIESVKYFEAIAEIIPECPSLEKVIFFGDDIIDSEDAVTLKDLEKHGGEIKESRPDLINKLTSLGQTHDIATLIYTSGTTGEPKGVMLSHENILSNVIDAGENYSFTKDDTPLSVLPLSHVFERTGMYLYIFNGMAVHYAESIEKVADNLKEVRPTMFVGVPRLFEKVYAKAKLKAAQESGFKEKIFDWAIDIGKEIALKKEKGTNISAFLGIKHSIADKLVFSKLRDFFGGRLRFCITGGAALSDKIYLIFNGANIAIMQGYGLTETSPVITSSNPLGVKLGTSGRTIRNVKIRIAEDGEVEVSGPNIMHGYFNKPEATRDTFSADGWFKTGDIGEIDDEGFLKITDRKKELFKTSGGKYIAPSPIEQMIKSSLFVSQVVLVGNSRKFAAALVVPDFDQLKSYAKNKNWNIKEPKELCGNENVLRLFEQEIDKYCEGLARFETVKKVALLEEELTVEGGELTPTLKIKRRIIDEKYADIIDKMYEDAEKTKPAR